MRAAAILLIALGLTSGCAMLQAGAEDAQKHAKRARNVACLAAFATEAPEAQELCRGAAMADEIIEAVADAMERHSTSGE